MRQRDHELLETYKALHEMREESIKKADAKAKAAINERDQFMQKYYFARNAREKADARRNLLMEAARNDAFKSIIKAIYITALGE